MTDPGGGAHGESCAACGGRRAAVRKGDFLLGKGGYVGITGKMKAPGVELDTFLI